MCGKATPGLKYDDNCPACDGRRLPFYLIQGPMYVKLILLVFPAFGVEYAIAWLFLATRSDGQGLRG